MVFSGAKRLKTNVVVFWGVQSSKKILCFQRLDRAETSYSPKWWAKDRSQGGEKKGGGGMSEPPSSPEKSMHCMVPAIQSFGHHWRSNESRRGWSFKPKSGWSLGVLAWGGNVGRFEPLASPKNPGGQRHKMFFFKCTQVPHPWESIDPIQKSTKLMDR